MLTYDIIDRIVLDPEAEHPTVVVTIALKCGHTILAKRIVQHGIEEPYLADQEAQRWIDSLSEETKACLVALAPPPAPVEKSVPEAPAPSSPTEEKLDHLATVVQDIAARLDDIQDALASFVASKNDVLARLDDLERALVAPREQKDVLARLDEVQAALESLSTSIEIVKLSRAPVEPEVSPAPLTSRTKVSAKRTLM